MSTQQRGDERRRGLAVIGIMALAVMVVGATRQLPVSYVPGAVIQVQVALETAANVTAVGLEEIPPADWAVTSISNGGVFDTINRKIKWGPFFAPIPTHVSYALQVPTSSTGLKCFDGTISYDGLNEPIGGDLCVGEGCPDATIADSFPLSGVIDARQPSSPLANLPRQGVGSAAEPIIIRLGPPVTGATDCFALCETLNDDALGPNSIAGVTDLGGGAYEIVLHHPITPGAVTTIQYTGDGSYIELTSHPANANADDWSDALDVLRLMTYLGSPGVSLWGMFSEDIDRSGATAPADILRAIDLLNGGGVYDAWLDMPLPVNAGDCPPP